MLMETQMNDITEQVQAASPWYRSAVATAMVSTTFCLIVLVFLVLNYGKSRVIDTHHETQLLALKTKLQDQSDNGELLSQVRTLDLQIRQRRLRAVDRSRKGGYLLLGGVIVLLVSVGIAGALKQKLPTPGPSAEGPDQQVLEAKFARWAVTAGLVVLGSGALLLVSRPAVDLAGVGASGSSAKGDTSTNWPSFRGFEGNGISPYTNVPTRWDGKTGEGILWKTKVPLPGNNSPIVWGNRIFLSGGDPNGLAVFCFDAASGRLLWTGDVTRAPLKADEEPLEPMEDTGWAAPTTVTDGRRVYAMFVTGDIAGFDFNGKKIWEKSLGTPENAYGHASSLAIYQNLVLIQYDQGVVEDGLSSIIALDGFTGEVAWQTKRPVDNSWCSPIVAQIAGQFQVITCSQPWVIAYEPAKGTELWRAGDLTGDMAPSPIYANRLVFVIEPYNRLIAIRPDGKGDVTKTHIAWSVDEGGPDICSPVSDGERIFMLGTEGLLICYKTSDGKKLWEHDLEEFCLASPSLVGKNMYVLSEKGLMFIIEAADEYTELAKCDLGEECHASPAFADRRIYIRGVENLYCIGNRD